MTTPSWADFKAKRTLERARHDAGRVWFYTPQWYWHGPRTLWPFMIGHDEFARRTLLLGWTFTGRIIIALWDCGDEECRRDAIADISGGDHCGSENPREDEEDD